MTVNRDAVRAWAEALESGKYKQGGGSLLDVSSFGSARRCCLGVACEIYRETTGKGEWGTSDASKTIRKFIISDDDQSDGILPDAVRDFFGFVEADPRLIRSPRSTRSPRPKTVKASYANDSLEWTFDHIARSLRETYLGEDTA